MATAPNLPATLDDLARVEGKAELIGGRIVPLMPTGYRPHRVAFRIARRIDDQVEATGRGHAFSDNMGFAVARLPSGRQSFSPDAAYFDGPIAEDSMRFVQGAPTFAVEVRSENDYGSAAEAAMAAKRADYFAAGTLVVWDVDPLAPLIRAHRADAPDAPTVYRPGDMADAEPALPGWRLDVAAVFG